MGRPQTALYVGGMGARGRSFYNHLFVKMGFEAEPRQIQELYLAGKKKEAEAAVPDAYLELGNLCGPEGFVRERIAAFQEAGVTTLNVSFVGATTEQRVAQCRRLAELAKS